MSNSTSSASLLFLTINSSVAVALFVVMYLPALILGSMYLVALVHAKGIHLKMKVLLVNITLPDLITVSGLCFESIFQPMRSFVSNDRYLITCVLYYMATVIGQDGNGLLAAVFAVVVFWSVKYNIKTFKWKTIIACLTCIWVFTMAQATLVVVSRSTRSTSGFCQVDLSAIILTVTVLSVSALAVCTLITVIFSVVSYHYVKRSSISDDSGTVKKSLVNLLVFEAAKASSILIRVGITIGVIVNLPQYSDLESIPSLILTHATGLFFGMLVLLTIIMSLVFLKPACDAFKQMFRPCHSSTAAALQ